MLHVLVTVVRKSISMSSVFYVICSFPGTAIRHCSDEKGWLAPELFNCTTVAFTHLKKLVNKRQK